MLVWELLLDCVVILASFCVYGLKKILKNVEFKGSFIFKITSLYRYECLGNKYAKLKYAFSFNFVKD
jgi:hypothetical protein